MNPDDAGNRAAPRLTDAFRRAAAWDALDRAAPETMPDLRGRNVAFFSNALVRGGSSRVLLEQAAALQPTGAASDVFIFSDRIDPAATADLRQRAPAVRDVAWVDRRVWSPRSLFWRLLRRRYDLLVSTDNSDLSIFARTLRKFGLGQLPPVLTVIHEEYDRYLKWFKPYQDVLGHVSFDYAFERGPAAFDTLPPDRMSVLAPLFPSLLCEEAEDDGAARRDLRRRLGIREDDLVLCYTGRLDRNKNIELLIWLMDELLNMGRENVWLLAAGRWSRAKYEVFIRQCVADLDGTRVGRGVGLRYKVQFLGSQPSFVPVLRASDVFVFPSLIEGFYPLVVIEAQSCGLPVVCTDVGGLRHAIEPGVTGLLAPTRFRGEGSEVTEHTRLQFLEHVLRLLDCPPRRQELGANGRAFARHVCGAYGFDRRFRARVAQLVEKQGAVSP